MRERIFLNDGWEFTDEWDPVFPAGEDGDPGGSTGGYTDVRLPHTCREVPFHYFDESLYQMKCGYRRVIRVPEAWRTKRVFLTVEAAGHYAEVFLNGEKVSEHGCGYTAFQVELKGLHYGGKDLLAISVDSREDLNIPPFGHVIDYMTFGGLYRGAWLDVTGDTRIADVFVKPGIPASRGLLHRDTDDTQARLRLPQIRFSGTVRSELTIDGDPGDLTIRQTVFERKEADDGAGRGRSETGHVLAEKETSAEACPVSERKTPDGTIAVFCPELELPDAALWDVLRPHLYILRTELLRGKEVIDRQDTIFGFRRTEFRPDGFFLNGRRLKIFGLNRHQSYPFAGYAMPESQQRRDADLLKRELGLNAVRTSHYPQSRHFIDRCDEIGLLVFTEIPGWQHIGDEAWKEQAVENTREMVLQYRNHPSVFLWGVRINESPDDDPFYVRTNAAAHALDETRPTGGVRCHRKSHLLEDVYTYNDFSHDGTNAGCETKAKVTSDMGKAYIVTEYNGHMFPTKTFDSELHRRDHALRHARVLDDIAGRKDIAGSFGWCFADYNTHMDFGSGDRICYHGVMDMFRNPKPAAAVYASQQEETPVLEVTSGMDIGEHPSGNQGRIFIFTNAEQVRMYKNGRLVKTYLPVNPEYPHLKHPPIEVDDFIGDILEKEEGFAPLQAKLVRDLLNYAAIHGFSHLPPKILAKAAVLMRRYHMTFDDADQLYKKYIGDWGGTATSWRFEAVTGGQVVRTAVKEPAKTIRLHAEADHTKLVEEETYDAAAVRLTMRDQNGNILPFYQGSVCLETRGPVTVIGPGTAQLRGGCGGTCIRTTGETGEAELILKAERGETVHIPFRVCKVRQEIRI